MERSKRVRWGGPPGPPHRLRARIRRSCDVPCKRSRGYCNGQIRTVMSKLPETTDRPSGRKQTERTVRP
jgi:hypothetical protein